MGRHFKYKQTNVLKAIEAVNTKTISIRDAAKRFGVSKQAIEYALKKNQSIHKELEKIQNLAPDQKTVQEVKQLTRLIYLSLEVLQEKLSKSKAKDLAIIASILIDKRNLLRTKAGPVDKNDFPPMSKKTKVLIEQFIFDKKATKDVEPIDIIDSVPINRNKIPKEKLP